MIRLKSNDRVLIAGATGTGKTVFARELTKHAGRLIALDSKASLSWLPVMARADRRRLLSGDPVRARVIIETLEDAEHALRDIYEAGNVTVYVDEVYGVVPPGKAPGFYLSAVWTRGRERGIGAVAATQRPAWVPLFILSEANVYVMFRLMLDKDKRRMAEFMGPEVLHGIPDPHGFYLYLTDWISRNKAARYYRRIRIDK